MSPLQAFGDDIWIAAGPTVESMGFHYPTRMAIIRLADDGLFLLSPVALSDAVRGEIAALGEVRHVVAPNSLHHVFLPEWRSAYPNAHFYAPPGLRERRKDVRFDADLNDAAITAWDGSIEHVLMRGNLITTEAVFFHKTSRTVLFTDLIQNFPRDWFGGVQALIASMDGMTGAEPQVPQKFRAAFVDRKAARAGLERIRAWPAENVIMAHGEPLRGGGSDFIARAFQWLR